MSRHITCDRCGAETGMVNKLLKPAGWGEVNDLDLCPECEKAYSLMLAYQERTNDLARDEFLKRPDSTFTFGESPGNTQSLHFGEPTT